MRRDSDTGSREREAAFTGTAKRMLDAPTLTAETKGPRARTARLHDQIEAGTAGIGVFGAHKPARTVTPRSSDPDEVSGDNPARLGRFAPVPERRDPLTIPRLVRTVIVDAVDLMSPRWLAAHVCEKIAIAIPPPRTDGDAAPAVGSPIMLLWIEASRLHGRPGSIFRTAAIAAFFAHGYLSKAGVTETADAKNMACAALLRCVGNTS